MFKVLLLFSGLFSVSLSAQELCYQQYGLNWGSDYEKQIDADITSIDFDMMLQRSNVFSSNHTGMGLCFYARVSDGPEQEAYDTAAHYNRGIPSFIIVGQDSLAFTFSDIRVVIPKGPACDKEYQIAKARAQKNKLNTLNGKLETADMYYIAPKDRSSIAYYSVREEALSRGIIVRKQIEETSTYYMNCYFPKR